MSANHTHTKLSTPASRHPHERLRRLLRTQVQRSLDGRLLAAHRRSKERALQAVKLRRNHGRRHVRIYRLIPNHTGQHAQARDYKRSAVRMRTRSRYAIKRRTFSLSSARELNHAF